MNLTQASVKQNVGPEVQAFSGINLVEKTQIRLINGLPGFEKYELFTLAELDGYAPFYAFRAVDAPEISMLVMHAAGLEIFTGIEISPGDLKAIGLDDEKDLELFVVLKVDQNSQHFTANVKAPLVFNFSKQLGNQVILDESHLSVEYPIFTITHK